MTLDPPKGKDRPGKLRRNNRRDLVGDLRKPGTLTKQGVEIKYKTCHKLGHNTRTGNKDKPSSSAPLIQRRRGRPKTEVVSLLRVEPTIAPQRTRASIRRCRGARKGRVRR